MMEHGKYSVTLKNDIITIVLVGMFNEMATKTVNGLIKEQVNTLGNKAFKILLDCSEYEGSTREAHQLSNEFLEWLNQQNCIARATVFSLKLYHDIVKNEQPALFGQKNRREFNNVDAANAWLKQW